jgi:uncharacterized membrane protein
LAYLLGFITGILLLKIESCKYDPFVRFHAFQSIFLSVAYGLGFWGWSTVIRMLVEARMGFIASILARLDIFVHLAGILLVLFLMYKALRFERFSVPVIGQMAAGFAG